MCVGGGGGDLQPTMLCMRLMVDVHHIGMAGTKENDISLYTCSHTINSARSPKRRCRLDGSRMLNLWCEYNIIYKLISF